MKKTTIILGLLLTGSFALRAQNFTLKSNEPGGQATQKQFANAFGCHGQNLSPELSRENAPAGIRWVQPQLQHADQGIDSDLRTAVMRYFIQ